MEKTFDEQSSPSLAMTGSGLRHKNGDLDRYHAVQASFSSAEDGENKPKPNPTSDSAKLVKSSLERKEAETNAVEKSPPWSDAKVANRPVSPPEAAPQRPISPNSPPKSRAARMKKLKNRRDRITVITNPGKPRSPPSKPPMSPATTSPVKFPTPSETHPLAKSLKTSPQKTLPDRKRVSGGAAAKLLGPIPREEDLQEKGSYETSSSVDAKFSLDMDEYSHASEEFDYIRRQARVEYDIGPDGNKRYRAPSESTDSEEKDDLASEASLPSILDRSEVFHENASAAILALLNPRGGRNDADSVVSGFSATSGYSSTFSPRSVPVPGASALSPPQQSQLSPSVGKEVSAVSALDSPHVVITKVPNQPLLNLTAEHKLKLMKKKMIDPSKTLADLLTAIATPPEGQDMDQAYMVRRKNACGAVKVLTATLANRKTLAWTVGVLPALASVLNDGGEGRLDEAFPDVRVRDEYIEARKRAVSALLNLCLLKDNRIPIFHCPNLVHGLAKTIAQDKKESRQGCSAILGNLSKTLENRLLLVRVPGILDAINVAIKPWSPADDSPRKKNKTFTWDLTDAEDTFSTSSEGRINSHTTGGGTTVTGDGTTTTDDYESTTEYTNGRNDEDSDLTPQMTTSPTSLDSKGQKTTSPSSLASKRSFLYDNDPNKFVHATRQNIFATLLHVVKEKDNAYHLARHPDLIFTLVDVSTMHESPSHIHAIKIICNLTRHRGNSKLLVFNNRRVVPAMVIAMKSPSVESRTYACRTLQNLSNDKSCRQDIAITKNLVESLVQRVRLASDQDEKLAAVCTLKNLSDEPSNLIPMTNTPECFATLMQIAHGKDGNTTEMMQFQACDALATLSHFLRKIASTGNVELGTNNGMPKASELMKPTLKVVTWSQWT